MQRAAEIAMDFDLVRRSSWFGKKLVEALKEEKQQLKR